MTDRAYDDPAIVLEVSDILVEESSGMWRYVTDWYPTAGLGELRVAVGSGNPLAVAVEEKASNTVRVSRLPDLHYPDDEQYVHGFSSDRFTAGFISPIGAYFRLSIIWDQGSNFRAIVRAP